VPFVHADAANIAATLPYLNQGQQADVLKAEQRFAQPEGYGMAFANGTGTGKTFLGLGIAKRFARQGKTEALIAVPNEAVMAEWVASAPALGLKLNPLTDTQDVGSGMAITTYANLGSNLALADRAYQFVIADEAHGLMMSADARVTNALQTLRAITLHPDGAYHRANMIERAEVARLTALSDQIKALEAEGQPEAERAKAEPLKAQARTIWEALQARRQEVADQVAAQQGEKRPRAVFLSATPFAYEQNVQWAEGYLFEFPEQKGTGYNAPNPYQAFMIQHFGWRMRTGKLNEPDAKVDRDLMQRNFNTWLRKQGVLSTRMLDVDQDYDRKFILAEDGIGRSIDDGLQWLRESENGRYHALYQMVSDRFDYLTRARLLESIKAKAAVPYIKAQQDLGRKVVVFYDFNQGGGSNIFNFEAELRGDKAAEPLKVPAKGQAGVGYKDRQLEDTTLGALLAEFKAARPDLWRMDYREYRGALDTLLAAYPSAGVYNGQAERKKGRLQAIKDFNNDSKPEANLLIVQKAANAGWSGHDRSGKFQRVLVNLGQPTAPVEAIQQEGRIYRVGQASDALFRYFNTGTMWERITFAQKISRRAGTAENLAMGEQARGLLSAFVQSFEDTDTHAPHANEGKGGKAADRALVQALSEWDKAQALYYAQQKKTSRNKAQEGTDYFATPEPLGYKLVEWLDVRQGDRLAEPSAGHGAIARWFPELNPRTVVEPSLELASRLALVTDAKLLQERFEDLHAVNKFEGMAMNPPFGVGGKTAYEHLAKAFGHLAEGGRVVAIVPDGPAANARLEKWQASDEAKHAHLRAEILLPTVAFERAGTSVATKVLVFDKASQSDNTAPARHIDLRNAGSVAELFERLKDMDVPPRLGAVAAQTPTMVLNSELDGRHPVATPAKEQAQAAPAEPQAAGEDNGLPPLVTYKTGKGKDLPGYVAHMTQAEAKAIDPYTMRHQGGWFIREKHAEALQAKLAEQGNAFNQTRQGFGDYSAGELERSWVAFDARADGSYHNNDGITLHPIGKTQRGNTMLRIQVDKRDAGFVIASIGKNGDFTALHNIEVDSDMRGQGIGERTVKAMLASNSGPMEIVDITNGHDGQKDARPFWKTLGTRWRSYTSDATQMDGTLSWKEYEDARISQASGTRSDRDAAQGSGGPGGVARDGERAGREAQADDGLGAAAPGGIDVEEISLDDLPEGIRFDQNRDTNEQGDPYAHLETRDGTTEQQRESGRSALAALGRLGNERARVDRVEVSGTRHLAAALDRGFREDGGNKLIGQQVNGAHDLAALAQVVREPGFETFRVFFTKSGQIVGNTAFSSRLAASVYMPKGWQVHIAQLMAAYGADGYWMLHNHPNGRAIASDNDLRMTRSLASSVPGFQGHVIIDHNEYAKILPGEGTALQHETISAPDLASVDFYGKPHLPHPILGREADPRAMADIAKQLQVKDGYVVLVGADFQGKVRMASEVALSTLTGGEGEVAKLRAMAEIRRAEKGNGAGGFLFAVVPGDAMGQQYAALRESGLLYDVVGDKGDSALARDAMAPERVKATRSELRGRAPTFYGIEQQGTQTGEQTALPAFKAWFAGSLATESGEAGGKPKVYYHGTNQDIDAFKDHGIAWVSASPALANDYARMKGFMAGGGANVMPVYVRAARPFNVDGPERSTIAELLDRADQQAMADGNRFNAEQAARERDAILAQWEQDGRLDTPLRVHDHWDTGLTAGEPLRHYLRTLGFDSLRYTEQGVDTFGVFAPNDVKSATGNRGSFDVTARSLIAQERQPFDERNPPPPDESSPTPPATAPEGGFSLPDESWLDRALTGMQDRFRPFKRLQGELKAQGGTVNEAQDVYAAEERYHGRAAAQLEDFREQMVKPLFEDMKRANLTMAQVSQFLHALHAEERNKAVAKINDKMKDGGSGMTTKDAKRILGEWASDPRHVEIQRIAFDFQQIADRRLDVLKAGGILDDEDVNRLRSIYNHYVPLKGDLAAREGTGPGYSAKHKQKRAMGHGEREELIVENLMRDYEAAIMLAEKNRVGQYLLSLIHTNQGSLGDLATINRPDKQNRLREHTTYTVAEDAPGGVDVSSDFDSLQAARDYIDAQVRSGRPRDIYRIMSSTEAKVYRAASPQLQENEAQVYVEGRPVRVTFRDAGNRLAAAYKNMDAAQFIPVLNIGLTINRWLSRAYTGWNPEFLLSNMRRDLTSGVLNLTANEGLAVSTKALKHYAGSVKAMMVHGATGKGEGDWAKWIRRYRELGGQTGAAWLGDMERYKQTVTLLEAEMNRSKANPLRAGKIAIDVMEHLNAAGENAFRLATFRAMVEAGHSENEAASAARNVTVNFNRRGNYAHAAGALYLFFNANVQGTARIVDGLLHGKHKAQAWALLGGLATLGFLAAAAMGAVGGGDGDDWEEIPDSVKSRNLVLPGPNGTQLLIPIPYGHGIAVQMGYLLADMAGGKSKAEAGWRMASSLFEHFSPIGNPINEQRDGKGVVNVLPTLVQDVVRPAVNLNGQGGQLYPDSGPNDSRPDNERQWRATKGTIYDRLADLPSRMMNTKYRDDWYDVSPETLKYWWSTLAGGSGRFFVDSASLINDIVEGGAQNDLEGRISLENVPIARTFARESSIKDTRSRFYRESEAVESAYQEFLRAAKAGDGDAVQGIMAEEGKLVALGKYLEATRKISGAIRNQQAAVMENEEAPLGKRRLLVKDLELREARVYDQFFRALKTAQEPAN